jgi:hypothetical protein
MAYINGQNGFSKINTPAASFSAATSVSSTANSLSSALSNVSSAVGAISAIRAVNLPSAGEAVGDIMGALSSFGGSSEAATEWRVRLSLANWVSFKSSAALKPLKDAGALIFPYTPQVSMSSTASYTSPSTVHTNYNFYAYQKSQTEAITITAPFFVEDSEQALYWIASLHYLRSLTKMFSGNDMKAGNPPPIVKLNGYGAYVMKNIPCVVTGVKVDLMNDCDYISTEVRGSAMGEIQGVIDSIAGLADTLSEALPSMSGGAGASGLSSLAGGLGQVTGVLGSFGVGGSTSGGIARVPTKSTMTVSLQPIYSRAAARNFSLDRFVGGGYMNGGIGYL